MIDSRAVFRRILIANRGEIARRIARACRHSRHRDGVRPFRGRRRARPGWRTWTRRCAWAPPPRRPPTSTPTPSCRRPSRPAARRCTRATASSPRTRASPRAAPRRGLTFIGPTPDALRRMGDKAVARRTLAAAGLPTVPGSPGILASPEEAAAVAGAVGYPVLLKAAAGGGGKGMRRCEAEGDLARAFARGVARGRQGLRRPRPVPGEAGPGARATWSSRSWWTGSGTPCTWASASARCSATTRSSWRRRPPRRSTTTSARRFGARVAAALASVGYRNAGTAEFLRAGDGALFFMEVNARLQVEHPVTEMVTGVDLVAAADPPGGGGAADPGQEDLVPRGHAIELRINAEDPDGRLPPGSRDDHEAPASRQAPCAGTPASRRGAASRPTTTP